VKPQLIAHGYYGAYDRGVLRFRHNFADE